MLKCEFTSLDMGLLAPGPGIVGADCLSNPLDCQEGSGWSPLGDSAPHWDNSMGSPITVSCENVAKAPAAAALATGAMA